MLPQGRIPSFPPPKSAFRVKLDEAGNRSAKLERPKVTQPSPLLPKVTVSPAPPKHYGSKRNLDKYENKAAEIGADLSASWIFEPDSIFSTAASRLLEAMEGSRRRRKKDSHWLCRILGEAAELLSGASFADLTARTVAAICRRAKLPWFVSKIIGQVAGKVIKASIPGSPTEVANFLKVVVVLICPNPDRCSYGTKAINFLLEPGVEATLRDLAGATGPNQTSAQP